MDDEIDELMARYLALPEPERAIVSVQVSLILGHAEIQHIPAHDVFHLERTCDPTQAADTGGVSSP